MIHSWKNDSENGFFFQISKKTVKNTNSFHFASDMKTENPKMAINYLFDVGFDSFAYSLDFYRSSQLLLATRDFEQMRCAIIFER